MKRHRLPLPTKSGGSAIVLADAHVPFQDKRALRLALKVASAIQPNYLVTLGDWADCFFWSKYKKKKGILRPPGFRRHWRADSEVQAVQETWDAAVEACPDATRIYLQGNHEERVRRITQEMTPDIEGKTTDFEHTFEVLKWWDKTYEYEDAVRIGHLWFTHGKLIRVHTAKCMLERWGTSVCFGHTHRWSFYSRRTKNGEHHGAFEVPCLCDLDAHYLAGPDWCQGFAVVHWVRSGLYDCRVVPILPGHKCIYDGQLFDLKGTADGTLP